MILAFFVRMWICVMHFGALGCRGIFGVRSTLNIRGKVLSVFFAWSACLLVTAVVPPCARGGDGGADTAKFSFFSLPG